MTAKEAMTILQLLMEGRDPKTGAFLSFGHTCLHPEVRQALHMAVVAMGREDAQPEAIWTRKNGKLNAGRPWTEEDRTALAEMYRSGVSIQKICVKLQRRERGVKRQLAYLGYIEEMNSNSEKRPRPGLERAGKPWTQAEDAFLRKSYQQNIPIAQIATQMRRSEYAIFCRMEGLSLYGAENGYPEKESSFKWTNENIREMRELYEGGESIPELAKRFNCSEKNISARLFYMGLIRESPLPWVRVKP